MFTKLVIAVGALQVAPLCVPKAILTLATAQLSVTSYQPVSGVAPFDSGNTFSLSFGSNYCTSVNATDSAGNVTVLNSAGWGVFGLSFVSGAYEYSDGSFATTCLSYLNSSAYNSEGSAIYRIDPDGAGGNAAYTVYCDMVTDGGGWTRILAHDVTGGFFANDSEAANHNQGNPTAAKYSILNQMNSLKSPGAYEFRRTWPTATNGCQLAPHQWTQTSNPLITSESVSGYVGITGGTTQIQGSAGLCLSSSSSTYMDGNCGGSNWWYATGQRVGFAGAIPACQNVAPHPTYIELYIR